MTDDLLSQMTRAMRDETRPETAADAGEIGKARLVRALRKADRPLVAKRSRLLVLVAAAMFIGVAAWADPSGTVRNWIFGSNDVEKLEVDTPKRRSSGSSGPSAPAPAAADPPASPISIDELPPPEPSAPPAPSARPSVHETIDRPAPPVARSNSAPDPSPPAPPAASPTTDVDLEALYRQATDAQFTRRDFNQAIALWDRYLAIGGAGAPMSLEAKYNRGIALYRAGRQDEAKVVLERFARGEYGGYRREDAKRILETF